MARYYDFKREDIFPSFFPDRLQDFLAGARTDLRLVKASTTKVAVVPDPALGVASIAIDGRWRFNEVTVERAVPGGAAGTYVVWAVALDNDVDNAPDPLTDHTDYTFDLRITAGEDPSGAGVEVFQKIGEVSWNGIEITAVAQTHASVTGPMIQSGALAGGDLAWGRNQDGSWQGQLKENAVGVLELADLSVDTNALIDLAVTTAKIAAGAITTNKLGISSVTKDVIAALAVEASKLAAEAVINEKIGNEAVSTAKIQNLAVTAAKLAVSAVETAKIQNLAVTAAKLAAEAVTPDKIGSVPTVKARRGTNQAIPNVAYTAIELDGEEWDSAAMHSTALNKHRLVAPIDGLYLVSGILTFEGNPNGIRNAVLSKNGKPEELGGFAETSSPGAEKPIAGAGGNALSPAGQAALKANDWVAMYAWQSSGGTLNVMGDAVHFAALTMTWIAPYPT